MNFQFTPIELWVKSYPPTEGKNLKWTEKRSTNRVAMKKYGIACRNVVIGKSDSSHDPRFHAASVPIVVPTTKLIMVDKPTRTMVQYMCCAMTCVMGTLPRVNE